MRNSDLKDLIKDIGNILNRIQDELNYEYSISKDIKNNKREIRLEDIEVRLQLLKKSVNNIVDDYIELMWSLANYEKTGKHTNSVEIKKYFINSEGKFVNKEKEMKRLIRITKGNLLKFINNNFPYTLEEFKRN